PQTAVALGQLGKSQGKGRVLLGRGLELLLGVEVLSVPLEPDPLVIVAQRSHGLSPGLEGTGFQFLEDTLRESKLLANGIRQTIDPTWNIFFARDLDLQWNGAVVLDVLERGVDADLVAEFGVLAPNQAIGAAEVSHAANSRRIKHTAGGKLYVRKHLAQTIGANCAHVRRMPY